MATLNIEDLPRRVVVDPLHPDGYKMGSLSRLTGLSPELIRAWQRRHGLFAPVRTSGQHRMFTADDLEIALWVRAEVTGGRSVSEVAALGREEILRRSRDSLPEASEEPRWVAEASGSAEGSTPFSACRRDLLEAAVRIDESAVASVLRRASREHAPGVVLGDIVRPALGEIGDAWAQGRVTVAGEHAVSGAIRTFVLLLLRAQDADPVGPPLVLACGPGELHEIPALLHGWNLRCQGASPRWFGADLPVAELDRACAAQGAQEVHLSFSRTETYWKARPALLAWAAGHAGTATLHLGGSGVPDLDAELSRRGVVLGR